MFTTIIKKSLPASRPVRSALAAALAGVAVAAPLQVGAQPVGSVTTIGGTGSAGYTEGAKGISQFSAPAGLALRGDGRLFVADYNNNAVRSIRLSDLKASTFVRASNPIAIAFDSSTNLFVANQGDGTVSKFDYFGNFRQTFRPPATGGSITALAIDRDDNLYVAELNGIVVRLTAQGFVDASYTAPGGGAHEFRGVAVANDGAVFVSDSAAHVLWKFSAAGAEQFAGTLFVAGNRDGEKGIGSLNRPFQIALGPNDSVVVADQGNHKIRAVSCGGVVTTLYGVDSSQWFTFPAPEVFPGWWDSSAEFAELREPVGVAITANGDVFDSEAYYSVIRAGTGLSFPLPCGFTTSTNALPVPVLQPSSGFYPNGVDITITSSNSPSGFSRDTKLYYTLDGRTPNQTDKQIPISSNGQASLRLEGPVDLAGLRVVAYLGQTPGPVTSATPTVVPTPILTPNAGYYPMGADVLVKSTNGFPAGTLLYYTTDGSDPTTNSISISHDENTGSFSWLVPQRDLRSLKVRAFLGPNAGKVVTGQAVSFPGEPDIQGEVGVPPARNDFNAGINSFYILPVIANLREGQALRSIQFVVEVTALPGSPRLDRTDLQVLPMSTNDFIQVLPASLTPPDSTTAIARDGVNRLAVAYFGTNSGFNVSGGFATIAMIGIQFRTQDSLGNFAEEGDGYTIRVTSISGTSDGIQKLLPLKAMPERTIHLKNLRFLEGDTSPGYWYNAGDFGNGTLENGDVNNSVFAAFGFRRPFPRSDVFAAMDVYRVGVLENVIEYNDAATILRRALGFENPAVFRQRNAGGEWESTQANGTLAVRARMRALATAEPLAWTRDAVISGGSIDKVEGYSLASVPVYMKPHAGVVVSGMQFVADVVSENGAPAVAAVNFVPALNVPPPSMYGSSVPGLGTLPNTVYARWDNLDPGIGGSTLLGTIQFTVPVGIGPGQSYSVVFRNTGGANIDWETGALTGYLFESVRATVWPFTPHQFGPSVSDDWKEHFFGSVNATAADAASDADGDGFTNYEEYLVGTDPTARNWHVRTENGQLKFRWVGEAGKTYTVETTEDFKGWNAASGQLSGQDAFLEYNEANPSPRAQFYRLKVK